MEYDQSGEMPTTGPLAEQRREERKTFCMNKSSLLRALRGKREKTCFPLTRRISNSEGENAGEFRAKASKRPQGSEREKLLPAAQGEEAMREHLAKTLSFVGITSLVQGMA